MLHHMQTAPMDKVIRQLKTQQSIESNTARGDKPRGTLYSPLGNDTNPNDNAYILGSERTGATPGQPIVAGQAQVGPAIVSEFNAENNEDGQVVPANQVMVDNFLNAQNAINFGSGVKLINPNQV